MPADAVFNYLHASFVPSEAWPMFQRAWLTASALGIAEKTHQAMFEAIWKTGELPLMDLATGRLKKPSPTIADAARFYARAAKIKESGLPEDGVVAEDRGARQEIGRSGARHTRCPARRRWW